jgi:arginase
MMEHLQKGQIKGKEGKIAIIGFPLDAHSSFMKGPASAPPLIREAFHCESSNLWSETGFDLGGKDLIFDAGDVDFATEEDAFSAIRKAIARLLDDDLIPISLGGDHAITYPIVQAFHQKFERIHILHFDAHPDLYDELDGDRHSHACPFARIMENGLVQRLVQVGIRGMNGHQRQQAQRFGVDVIEMKDWRDDIVLTFDAPLYISFDTDALDPAFAPGVSHFEPGGLSTRQAIGMIHGLKAPKIIGADIVEYNPQRDPSGVTAMVCAKIMKEIAGRILK